MGAGLSSVWEWFGLSQREARLLILGLDASGKSVFLYRTKLGETVTTIPTIGFNVETVQYKNLKFTMWDVCAGSRIRPLWRHYFDGTHGVIWVVDSTDRQRMKESAQELERVAGDAMLHGAAFLIFANKQDLPGAMSPMEVVSEMGLAKMMNDSNHPWFVQGSAMTLGLGINEGLEWLSTHLPTHAASSRAAGKQ
jgi:small GTP-binding protein